MSVCVLDEHSAQAVAGCRRLPAFVRRSLSPSLRTHRLLMFHAAPPSAPHLSRPPPPAGISHDAQRFSHEATRCLAFFSLMFGDSPLTRLQQVDRNATAPPRCDLGPLDCMYF